MRLLQVHEYQHIRIGETIRGVVFTEKDCNALAAYWQAHQGRYYKLQHRGIRFSHYVGALQVGDLTIEILPKADKNSPLPVWRDALLDMLRYCKILKIHTLDTANLQHKNNSILELYYERYLDAVDALLRQGLQKDYQLVTANSTSAKGQIQFHQHIQKNRLHQERFYTRFQAYNHSNLLNQILWAALEILNQLPLSLRLTEKLKAIQAHFPKIAPRAIDIKDFARLRLHRRAAHYKEALDIAELLIGRFRPDIRSGMRSLIAVLFDMNVLFEEYVFRQLQQLQNDTIQVFRQQSKSFWNRRSIRPDMVLQIGEERVVLDTKWKILERVQPSMQDVQQAFVYSQYFNAQKVALIYPKVNPLKDLPPTVFQPFSDEKKYFCQVHFADIIQNERLNIQVNQSILNALTG